MNKLKILFFSTLFVIFTVDTNSQSVSEKGIASIELDRSTCRDGKPADKNKHFEAIEKAKLSAWNKYTATLSSDIANASIYLLSDQANYITGTEMIVDGGLTSKP